METFKEQIFISTLYPGEKSRIEPLAEQANGDVRHFRALYANKFGCSPTLYNGNEIRGKHHPSLLLVGHTNNAQVN